MDSYRDLPHRQTDHRLKTEDLLERRRARARGARARLVLGATAVAASAALIVSACTSGPSEAGPTPSPSVTPAPSVSAFPATPSPTPTRTPGSNAEGSASSRPLRPAGMDANTAEGARETALYFIKLYPYMMRTGDTREWDRLSVTEHCDFCSQARAQALATKKHHETYVGGAVTATVTTTYELDTRSLSRPSGIIRYTVLPLAIEIDEESSRTTDKAGKTIRSSKKTTTHVDVDLTRSKQRWMIRCISTDYVEPGS